jgi:hypothetical protein
LPTWSYTAPKAQVICSGGVTEMVDEVKHPLGLHKG